MVDYSNKKAINDATVGADEVLVPIRADEILQNYKNDTADGLRKKGDGINPDNIETWHLGGRKILVGFIPVKKEVAEAAIKGFWDDMNSYIEATRKKRCLIPDGKGGFVRCPREKKCCECDNAADPDMFTSYELSLDEFMKKDEESGEGSWDPTGIANVGSDTESIVSLRITLAELINDLANLDPEMAKCITLLSEGYKKKEVIDALALNLKKSQAYAFIEKCQKKAKEIYDKKYR